MGCGREVSPRRRTARLALRLVLAGSLLPAAFAAPGDAVASQVGGSVRVLEKGGGAPHESFADAVVWLSGSAAAEPGPPLFVNQVGKRFLPRVLPVVRGQVVNFLNQDPIEHNVFSREARPSFDLGRYPKNQYRPVRFDELGTFKVYCNIHKAMILDVVVLDTNLFAVTDAEGSFRIEGVPAGRYRLDVWHIYGGTHTGEVEVDAAPIALDPIVVTSTKVIREVSEHLDKTGQPYRNPMQIYRKR